MSPNRISRKVIAAFAGILTFLLSSLAGFGLMRYAMRQVDAVLSNQQFPEGPALFLLGLCSLWALWIFAMAETANRVIGLILDSDEPNQRGPFDYHDIGYGQRLKSRTILTAFAVFIPFGFMPELTVTSITQALGFGLGIGLGTSLSAAAFTLIDRTHKYQGKGGRFSFFDSFFVMSWFIVIFPVIWFGWQPLSLAVFYICVIITAIIVFFLYKILLRGLTYSP